MIEFYAMKYVSSGYKWYISLNSDFCIQYKDADQIMLLIVIKLPFINKKKIQKFKGRQNRFIFNPCFVVIFKGYSWLWAKADGRQRESLQSHYQMLSKTWCSTDWYSCFWNEGKFKFNQVFSRSILFNNLSRVFVFICWRFVSQGHWLFIHVYTTICLRVVQCRFVGFWTVSKNHYS